MNKRSTLEIETMKRNQIEILELKKSINEMKNELETSDHMEERMSDLKVRHLKMTQVEEN